MVRQDRGLCRRLSHEAVANCWCSRTWQSGWLDFVEECEGFGGVRAYEAFQAGRRDLRPSAGPCPHLFLEGADTVGSLGGNGTVQDLFSAIPVAVLYGTAMVVAVTGRVPCP